MLTNAPQRTCAVEGCDNPHIEGRGYCLRHYTTWRTHGDATFTDRKRQKAAEKRALLSMQRRERELQRRERELHVNQTLERCEPSPTYTPLPGYELHDSYRSTLLWLCVLLQAVRDATSAPWLHEFTITPAQREQARAWLLTFNPDFALVCDLAGLHPSYVRMRARAFIEQRDKLNRMAAAFTTTRGYVQTFDRTPGTGGGRRAPHLPGSDCCNQLHGARE